MQAVSLAALSGINTCLKTAYISTVAAVILCGALTLALQNWNYRLWVTSKRWISCILSGIGLLLFVISRQSYAAVLLLICFTVKILLLKKR